jgi:hypothetical protein
VLTALLNIVVDLAECSVDVVEQDAQVLADRGHLEADVLRAESKRNIRLAGMPWFKHLHKSQVATASARSQAATAKQLIQCERCK